MLKPEKSSIERLSVEERYLSLNEIARYLGLSPKTLYVWADRRRVPAYKVGRVWRFDRQEIDVWVKKGGSRMCYNSPQTCGGIERNGGL